MFDDFAVVIETKDVNPGVFQPLWPDLVAMQDNELSIGIFSK